MTTHGRSGFIRWILGSVTENVVRASGDLVLVIPPTVAKS
jgi:nucleotide-binding universal stress UspA family protein